MQKLSKNIWKKEDPCINCFLSHDTMVEETLLFIVLVYS